jgi:hydrogenase maturation protein HypF
MFHRLLARLLAHKACDIAALKGTDFVALSGGVFQNPLFLKFAVDYVRERGFRPLWQQVFPPNDGGISLGQALVARARAGSADRYVRCGTA